MDGKLRTDMAGSIQFHDPNFQNGGEVFSKNDDDSDGDDSDNVSDDNDDDSDDDENDTG